MKLDVGKLLNYVFVAGLALLTQYASDKQTEKVASAAAGNAVINVLTNAGLIEQKEPSNEE